MNVRNESILHPVHEPRSAVKYWKICFWYGLAYGSFFLFISLHSGQKDKPKYLFSHLENILKKDLFRKMGFYVVIFLRFFIFSCGGKSQIEILLSISFYLFAAIKFCFSRKKKKFIKIHVRRIFGFHLKDKC